MCALVLFFLSNVRALFPLYVCFNLFSASTLWFIFVVHFVGHLSHKCVLKMVWLSSFNCSPLNKGIVDGRKTIVGPGKDKACWDCSATISTKQKERHKDYSQVSCKTQSKHTTVPHCSHGWSRTLSYLTLTCKSFMH